MNILEMILDNAPDPFAGDDYDEDDYDYDDYDDYNDDLEIEVDLEEIQ